MKKVYKMIDENLKNMLSDIIKILNIKFHKNILNLNKKINLDI